MEHLTSAFILHYAMEATMDIHTPLQYVSVEKMIKRGGIIL